MEKNEINELIKILKSFYGEPKIFNSSMYFYVEDLKLIIRVSDHKGHFNQRLGRCNGFVLDFRTDINILNVRINDSKTRNFKLDIGGGYNDRNTGN